MVSRKPGKFENPGENISESPLWSITAKQENIWTNVFIQEVDQESRG